jgi:NADH dehydrogenase
VSDKILGAFDAQLQDYASERFRREGITIKPQHHVERVEAVRIRLFLSRVRKTKLL